MEDKDFDELFEVSEDKDYTKKVAKGINQSIYKRIFKTLLVGCLSITGIYFGTSAFISKINYDPNSVKLTTNTDKNSFNILLLTYLNMYYPGYEFSMQYGSYVPEGFSRYLGEFYKLSPLEKYKRDNNQSKIGIEIKGSRLYVDFGSSEGLERFSGDLDPTKEQRYDEYTDDYILSEINELPESSRIEMMAGFTEYRTFDEVAQLISMYPELSFNWVATNTEGADGFSLKGEDWLELNETSKDKYPNLLLATKQPNGQEMEEHFRSSIKLLLDNPEFIELVQRNIFKELTNSDRRMIVLQPIDEFKLEEDLKQEKIYSVGVNFNGKKQDVLNFLENESVQRYQVKDVALSFIGN